MARGFQGSRRRHQRSAAVPSRSATAWGGASEYRSKRLAVAELQRLGTAALRHGGSTRRRSAIHGNPMPEHQRTLSLRNCQRVRRVNLRLLRRIVSALLRETWPHASFDLAICLVAEPEMTRLNETFLRHKGSTDVITFDYAEAALLHGEVFICLDEAVSQARRFHAIWQSELVRYVVHGVLHLLSYDDRDARARRRMKEAEDTLVRQLARQFDFQCLGVR